MGTAENNTAILLVSSGTRLTAALGARLSPARFSLFSVATAVEGEEALLLSDFDAVILDLPLRGGGGVPLARRAARTGATGVLLLVKEGERARAEAALSGAGILVLGKPVGAARLTEALALLCSTSEKLRRLAARRAAAGDGASLSPEEEDVRLIHRAKWLLMTELRMSEPQAHRYIEKQAMDRCVPKRRIAENILATYK